MLKVPVHTRCNVPLIVLKKNIITSTSAPSDLLPLTKNKNENENESCVGVSDNKGVVDKNIALKSYAEQIICIPPYVTQEHSAEHSGEHFKEHSHDSAKDLISIEVMFHVVKK